MAVQDVLSARLEVKDSFTSQLSSFITKTNNAEKAFEKFINSTDMSARILEKTFDVLDKKIDSVITKIGSKTEAMNNKIASSANKIEQTQTKAINSMASKYGKMGENVQGIFKTINKDAETLAKSGIKLNVNGGKSNSTGGGGHNHGGSSNILGNTDRALTSLLSGDFQMMAMQMGVIGGAILGVSKILSTIENWTQQGFNALNNLSGNLLSYDGLKEGLENAGQFETNRVAMDVLYGNNPVIGQQYYKMGTYLAKKTPYSEQSVGALQKKLAGSKVTYNQDDLMTLLDIASIKPELGAEHVGFSIVDAMAGRSTSLKTNYMLDNKEINKYLQEAMKGKVIDATTGQKVDGKKWKDAFNKTGTVNNKQEYLDLLISYVKNETKYSGLTERYSKTMNGLIDRIKGNWETVQADLLGIDANNTGTARPGINAFNAVKNFLDYMDNWLSSSKATTMLESLGTGLGTAVDSIATAVEELMENGQFERIGKVFEGIGKSISDFITRLDKNGTLDKIIDKLPDLVGIVLNNEAIKLETDFNTKSNIATGNVGEGVKDWVIGKQLQVGNYMGDKNANWNTVDDLSKNKSLLNQWWDKLWQPSDDNNTYLSDMNASAYLSQNPNLTNDQVQTIQSMMKDDMSPVYNITIGEIKADSFDEIIQSIQQAQANQK